MRIGIVGAGITGLTCAYRFLQRGHDVIVLEKDRELGGLSGSFLLAGNFLEKYYQYIVEDEKEILDLIDDLSLSSELLWFKPRNGLFYNGTVNPFDTLGNILSIRGLSLIDRIRFSLSMARLKSVSDWKNLEDITAETWLRNLGGSSLFRSLWTHILKGRFENHYTEVSAVFLWARYGRTMGKKIGYFKGGFQRMIEVLGQKITAKNGSIRTTTLVKSVSPTSDGGVKALTEKGPLNFDILIVTTPVPIFMGMTKDLPLEYSMGLNSIEYMSKVSLILEIQESFGFTYFTEICDPSCSFSEIVEHTNLLPSENYDGSHIIYILNYVKPGNVYMNYSPQKLLDDYLPHLRRIKPKFDQSSIKKVNIFRANHAYPIITCNYSRKLPPLETPLKGIYLSSNAQIYPEERNINSCVHLANQTVERLLASKETAL